MSTDSQSLTKVTQKRTAVRGKWQHDFIKALRAYPNVTSACENAQVSRVVAYRLKHRSQKFSAQWDDAIKESLDKVKASLWQVATIGERKPIWMKDATGEPIKVDELYEINVQAALALLRAHDPAFKEVVRNEHTGPDGNPIAVNMVIEWPHEAIKHNGNGHIKQLEEGSIETNGKDNPPATPPEPN